MIENEILDFDLLLEEYNNSHIIEEYKEFLISNDFIFSNTDFDRFPKISLEWDTPALVSNVIIEIESPNLEYLFSALKEFNKLGVQHVELRFWKITTLLLLIEALEEVEKTSVVSATIIINNLIGINNEDLISLTSKYKRIIEITLYNSPENRTYLLQETQVTINNISDTDLSNKHCGLVKEEYFSVNIPHFTESLHYNSCLNRKISIDIYGNIKNCPSIKANYGNVKFDSLYNVLVNTNIKENWGITKDQIETCKNCEFRYVCTDCRAYIENPNNINSKPLKCGYNPETCMWEDWSDNPLKKHTINYYSI